MSPNKEEEFIELDLKRILEKYLKEREAKEDWKTESPASLQLEKTKGKTADLRHLTGTRGAKTIFNSERTS